MESPNCAEIKTCEGALSLHLLQGTFNYWICSVIGSASDAVCNIIEVIAMINAEVRIIFNDAADSPRARRKSRDDASGAVTVADAEVGVVDRDITANPACY